MPAGRVTIVDYKSSDVRDAATASRRARESLQLAIYGSAWEAQHGRPPDDLVLHFLESGIEGHSAPTPEAPGGCGGTGRHGRRWDPRRKLRRQPVSDPLRATALPRDLPRRDPMTPRSRIAVAALVLLAVLGAVVLVAFAGNACAGDLPGRPCPDAGVQSGRGGRAGGRHRRRGGDAVCLPGRVRGAAPDHLSRSLGPRRAARAAGGGHRSPRSPACVSVAPCRSRSRCS